MNGGISFYGAADFIALYQIVLEDLGTSRMLDGAQNELRKVPLVIRKESSRVFLRQFTVEF